MSNNDTSVKIAACFGLTIMVFYFTSIYSVFTDYKFDDLTTVSLQDLERDLYKL